MRIAYVEDNPTNLALVERVVSMGQHKITSYTEGEIAVQALTRERFDLILMDIELAGDVSGLQVVKNLRAFGLKTPIVAVTAYAMLGDREKCIEAGCDDYLPKPIPIMDLVKLLARYDALVTEKRKTDEIKRKTDELKRKADETAAVAPSSAAPAEVKPQLFEAKEAVAAAAVPVEVKRQTDGAKPSPTTVTPSPQAIPSITEVKPSDVPSPRPDGSNSDGVKVPGPVVQQKSDEIKPLPNTL